MNPKGVQVIFARVIVVHSSINIRKIKLIAYNIYIYSQCKYIFTLISLCRLFKNYQGDHIYKQIENLHTMFVQIVEWHLWCHYVYNVKAMLLFFYDDHVKFDLVTSGDTMLFMEL